VIEKSQRFDWLQALRGLAALGGVLAHVRLQFPNTPLWETADVWLRGGESGVDLFFVISGFIMIHTIGDDRGGLLSAMTFAIKRLARIWPAYAVVTLAVGFLFYRGALFSDAANLRALINSLAFVPNAYDKFYGHQIVAQGWTLNYEMYFYLVLALCLLAGPLRWIIFCAWFIFTLLCLPLLAHAPSLTDPVLAFSTDSYSFQYLKIAANPIIWEFVGGALAGWLFQTRLRFGSPILAWSAVLVAAALCARCVFDVDYSHGPLQWGWSYILLVLALAIASKDIKLSVPALSVKLGDISYTLYLTHVIVIVVASELLSRLTIDRLERPLEYSLALVCASVATAALSSRFLERTLPNDFRAALAYAFDFSRLRAGSAAAYRSEL
jgi:exopolysaccharide production protein ExoZ